MFQVGKNYKERDSHPALNPYTYRCLWVCASYGLFESSDGLLVNIDHARFERYRLAR